METKRFALFKNKIGCKISGVFKESEIKDFEKQGWEEQSALSCDDKDRDKLFQEAEKGQIIRII